MSTLPAVSATGSSPVRRAAATLLLCCLLPASSDAGDAEATRDLEQGTIVPAAGGRLQFLQRGSELILPTADGSTTTTIQLPGKWVVESAARVSDSTWISGRSNDAAIDDMFVAQVDADGQVDLLPTPAGRQQPRGRTGLLVERSPGGESQVVGITWLEGAMQETTSVRAAVWTGEDWGPPEIVAPPLGREQTHLVSTVLADGSWLAAWAAVDGTPGGTDGDDDVWWSMRTDLRWSKPERLVDDNDVPDIYPHVSAAGDSALAVWSWYDGNDYRLRLAMLEGNRWTELPIESGRGTIPGQIVSLPKGVALLSSSVEPKGTFISVLSTSGVERTRWELADANDLEVVVRFNQAQPLLQHATSGEMSPLAPVTGGGAE